MRRLGRRRAVLASLLVMSMASVAIADAARGHAGTPDPGFGKHGRAVVSLPKSWVEGSFTHVAPTASGGLLVAYDALTDAEEQINSIERLEADGSLDKGFGKGGSVSPKTSFGVTALAEDSAGGVVYGALGKLERLEPDGAPDRSFDKAAAVRSLAEFRPERIVVTTGGEIVVAGAYGGGTPNVPARGDTVVFRFEADGEPDKSFGEGGSVSIGGSQQVTGGLGVLADGSILVLGPKVQRIAADGTLETTPEVELAPGNHSLAVFPDGGFAVATTSEAKSPTCTVSRYRADGSLDPEFAQAGVFTRAATACDELIATPDGGLLLVELSGYGHKAPLQAIRLDASGAPVSGFGEGGTVRIGMPAGADPGETAAPSLDAATITTGGEVVVAGGNRDAILVALGSSGAPDQAFGDDGAVARRVRRPSRTYIRSMVTEPNGELIVTAASDSGRTRPLPVWLRFTAAGKLRRTSAGGKFRSVASLGGGLTTDGSRHLLSLNYGGGDYYYELAEWNRDGSLVGVFGRAGRARLPAALDPTSFVVDDDGSVTVFGAVHDSFQMAAYRLTAKGRPDRRFDRKGLALVDFAGHERSRALAAVAEPDGGVVLVGHRGSHLALAELGADGRVRRGFGHDGTVICGCGAGRPERAKALAYGGDLYVLAQPPLAHAERATLVKFTAAGALDRSFGRHGHRWVKIGAPLGLFARGHRLLTVGQLEAPIGSDVVRAVGLDGSGDRDWGGAATLSAGGGQVGSPQMSVALEPRGPLVIGGERKGATEAAGNRLELLGLRTGLATTVRPRLASTSATTVRPAGLAAPGEKEIAMELVSSAENSTLDWRSAYSYIEDIGDGRGYTAGLIGFCSGTGDMLQLVRSYVAAEPRDPLARFLPALRRVDGTASHAGLGKPFVAAWKRAARDPVFRRLQLRELDRVYFDPAVRRAKADGLGTLGQFIYYDAIVMHGPGQSHGSFGWIRAQALRRAKTPAEGGDEATYLNDFLDVRRALMKSEAKHGDTSRIDDEQRRFLREGNFALRPPLVWHTYGDRYEIAR